MIRTIADGQHKLNKCVTHAGTVLSQYVALRLQSQNFVKYFTLATI